MHDSHGGCLGGESTKLETNHGLNELRGHRLRAGPGEVRVSIRALNKQTKTVQGTRRRYFRSYHLTVQHHDDEMPRERESGS